jgi:hypothetical protein
MHYIVQIEKPLMMPQPHAVRIGSMDADGHIDEPAARCEKSFLLTKGVLV